MKPRDNTKPDPSVADLGDAELEGGINWDTPNPFTMHKEDAAYRYYYAVDRAGVGGTVSECTSLGYEVDPTQKSTAPGHTLMRIPVEKWRQREAAQMRRQRLMQSGITDTDGKFDLPVTFGRHEAGEGKVR